MTTVRTNNMDLAAALWAYGLEVTITTTDGVVVDFVFPKEALDGKLTEGLIQAWKDGVLLVNARDVSIRMRRLRTMMRKTIDDYATERKKTLHTK